MKFQELVESLEKISVTPSKSLGQNFLHDRNTSAWIVRQAQISPGDPVLEIGPGLGSLTEWLVAAEADVFCVEKDARLAEFVAKRFEGQVKVVNADATSFDTRDLYPKGPLIVVANLPYYVTSPILERFADPLLPVRRLVLTVQKEMAERLAASPGGKIWGGISAVLQRDWTIRRIKNLPPGLFYPEPGVDSSVILLERREPEPCDRATYIALVKAGFSQRRKQLKKMIGSRFEDWEAATTEIGTTPTVRAEELTIAQWAALARILVPHGVAQRVDEEIFDVVDEEDRVAGQETRANVHARGLRHRAVHILVTNKEGEIYLQKRSRWKDKHPSTWDSSAAGHVESGDDYDETAAREVVEELGKEMELQQIAQIEACDQTGWEFVRVYLGKHSGPFVSPPSEVEGGRFFALEQIERWIVARPQDFAPGFVRCFSEFQQHSPKPET